MLTKIQERKVLGNLEVNPELYGHLSELSKLVKADSTDIDTFIKSLPVQEVIKREVHRVHSNSMAIAERIVASNGHLPVENLTEIFPKDATNHGLSITDVVNQLQLKHQKKVSRQNVLYWIKKNKVLSHRAYRGCEYRIEQHHLDQAIADGSIKI